MGQGGPISSRTLIYTPACLYVSFQGKKIAPTECFYRQCGEPPTGALG